MNVEIKQCLVAKIDDVPDIVIIHQKAFKGFFLTSLGKGFLKAYYKSCLRDAKAVALIAIGENKKPIGFAIGTIKSKGFHENILKNNFLIFLIQGIIISFKKPVSIFRLFKNLNKDRKKEIDDGEYAELLSIGVLPNKKKKGIGKDLLLSFEKELKKRECTKVTLTTDFYNNEYAVSFYKKTGYNIFYDFVAFPNRKMYKMIKEL